MKKDYLVVAFSFPPEAGGVAEYIYNFSKSLDARITVLACTIKKIEAGQEDSYPFLKEITVKRVPYLYFAPFLTTIRLLISAAKLQRQGRFNLIICSHPLVGFVGRFMKKAFGIDYILITHGWEVSGDGIYRGRFKRVLKDAKSVIANSGFTKNSILGQYPELDNIHIIPPIVNDELIKRDIDKGFKEKLGLLNKKILLTVSRLDANTGRKGHDLALMALPEILNKHPDVVYIIVGSGTAQKMFKEFARSLNIDKNVMFFDYDRRNIHNYYNICDVFIMPSRMLKESGSVEGFGIVYLEAALFAKPSIGGRSGGVGEAVLDAKTGLLVDPLNPSDIAKAVIRLLGDPVYSAMLGNRARERALEEFCAEKISLKIKNILALEN